MASHASWQELVTTAAVALLPLLRRDDAGAETGTPHYARVLYRVACYVHWNAMRATHPLPNDAARADFIALVDASANSGRDSVRPVEAWRPSAMQRLREITCIMDLISDTYESDLCSVLLAALRRDRFFNWFLRVLHDRDIDDALAQHFGGISADMLKSYLRNLMESIAASNNALPASARDPDLFGCGQATEQTRAGHHAILLWMQRLFTCWLGAGSDDPGVFGSLCASARDVRLAYPDPALLVFPLRFWNSLVVARAELERTIARRAAYDALESRARQLLRITASRGFQCIDLESEVFSLVSGGGGGSNAAIKAPVPRALPDQPVAWMPRCIDHLVRHGNELKDPSRRALARFATATRPRSSPEQLVRELQMISRQVYPRRPGAPAQVEFKTGVRAWMQSYQQKGTHGVDESEKYNKRCRTLVIAARDEFRAYIERAAGKPFAAATAGGAADAPHDSRRVLMYTDVVSDVEDILDAKGAPGTSKPMCPIAFDLMMREVRVVFSANEREPAIDTSGIYHKYKLDLTPHALRACAQTAQRASSQTQPTAAAAAATGAPALTASVSAAIAEPNASPISLWVAYARQNV